MQAAFCSWYSTGGEIEGLLTQLPLSDLNSTGTYEGGSAGVMFEKASCSLLPFSSTEADLKFNMTDPDAAGGGGEYEVVVGKFPLLPCSSCHVSHLTTRIRMDERCRPLPRWRVWRVLSSRFMPLDTYCRD